MAFTYDLDTAVGQVRLLIPDTDEETAALQDAEISYFLIQRGSNVRAAAVDCCKQLARRYAQQFSFTADGLRADLGQRAEMFAKRAAELEQNLGGGLATASLDRNDGYSDAATDSEYASRTVYIQL